MMGAVRLLRRAVGGSRAGSRAGMAASRHLSIKIWKTAPVFAAMLPAAPSTTWFWTVSLKIRTFANDKAIRFPRHFRGPTLTTFQRGALNVHPLASTVPLAPSRNPTTISVFCMSMFSADYGKPARAASSYRQRGGGEVYAAISESCIEHASSPGWRFEDSFYGLMISGPTGGLEERFHGWTQQVYVADISCSVGGGPRRVHGCNTEAVPSQYGKAIVSASELHTRRAGAVMVTRSQVVRCVLISTQSTECH
ncbi:hypothetical protein C8R43DRAFT_964548 [Mycena crocata]|nr:hypothetical protein C8R43DRAFT_964548 [Mycena crocata]